MGIRNPWGIQLETREPNSKRRQIREYTLWNGMIERCRSDRIETYKHVSVSEDFLDFRKFYGWVREQKGFYIVDIKGKPFEMDKDILSGSLYSAETIAFIPRALNALCKKVYKKTNLPKGVQYFAEKAKPYRVYSSLDKKLTHYGYFKTLEEATQVAKESRYDQLEHILDMYEEDIEEHVLLAVRNNFERFL